MASVERMARSAPAALALVSVLVLAGCVSNQGAVAQKSASSPTTVSVIPSAATAAPSVDTGSIAGRVVDDERYPIYGALVTVREANRTAEADASGAVTFNGVAPGTYSLFASRLGYTGAALRVTVTAGAVANATLVLRPLAIETEPFTESKHHTSFIQFGYSWLSVVTFLVNDTGLHEMLCQGCIFSFDFSPKPQGALSEAMWQCSPCQDPVLNADNWFLAYKNGTSMTLLNTYLKNRQHYNWTAAQTPPLKSAANNRFTFRLEGGGGATAGAGAANYNQKIEFWQTMSFHEDIPDNFTALPPP